MSKTQHSLESYETLHCLTTLTYQSLLQSRLNVLISVEYQCHVSTLSGQLSLPLAPEQRSTYPASYRGPGFPLAFRRLAFASWHLLHPLGIGVRLTAHWLVTLTRPHRGYHVSHS